MSSHPCQSCGACCAYFSVKFYWREAEGPAAADRGPVPSAFTENYSDFQRCMKGTNEKHHNHCVALSGKVGVSVSCAIYRDRPTPCREFAASYEDGVRRPRCDEARAAYGLAPLKREDWGAYLTNEQAPPLRSAHSIEPNLRPRQGK